MVCLQPPGPCAETRQFLGYNWESITGEPLPTDSSRELAILDWMQSGELHLGENGGFSAHALAAARQVWTAKGFGNDDSRQFFHPLADISEAKWKER